MECREPKNFSILEIEYKDFYNEKSNTYSIIFK